MNSTDDGVVTNLLNALLVEGRHAFAVGASVPPGQPGSLRLFHCLSCTVADVGVQRPSIIVVQRGIQSHDRGISTDGFFHEVTDAGTFDGGSFYGEQRKAESEERA